MCACDSLAAFITAVESQRGNNITSAQANHLIAAAQQIQVMLNCATEIADLLFSRASR